MEMYKIKVITLSSKGPIQPSEGQTLTQEQLRSIAEIWLERVNHLKHPFQKTGSLKLDFCHKFLSESLCQKANAPLYQEANAPLSQEDNETFNFKLDPKKHFKVGSILGNSDESFFLVITLTRKLKTKYIIVIRFTSL